MKDYVGHFSSLLRDFVTFKRSLGFKFENEADELYRFSRFTVSFDIPESVLTKELVQAWSALRPGESARNNRRRVYPVRQFGIYLHSLGHNAYIAAPDPKAPSFTFVPYIFTEEEMGRVFTASDRILPNRNSSLPLIMPVILRMIYSGGLRISEAVNLKNKHVHLADGILEIKNSKFGKDRLVPMSDSMVGICRSYYRFVHEGSSEDDYFFMSANRNPITCDNVYRRFRDVLWEAGISHGGKGHGPRVHDLRHTFAVHSLQHAARRGIDVYCALPILSTFLGHASITATEQYVRLTMEAFPEVCAALEKYCAHVIPQVSES